MTIFVSVQAVPSSFMRSASSSRTRSASAPSQPVRASQSSSRMLLLEALDLLDLEAGLGQKLAPLVLGVAAHVGRVAQLLGLLVPLARVERVLDHDEPVADALQLGDRGANVLEVVRRDPRDDDVEGAVLERDVLGGCERRPPASRATGRA